MATYVITVRTTQDRTYLVQSDEPPTADSAYQMLDDQKPGWGDALPDLTEDEISNIEKVAG